MPRGLFSGDMMDNMPVPTIIVHVPGQGTCLYTAEDDELIHWKPHPNNPVIPSTNAPPEATVTPEVLLVPSPQVTVTLST